MPLILPARTLDSGYEIDNSLRFNPSDSAKLNFTQGTPTSRRKWTYSTWVKRGNLGNVQASMLSFGSSDFFDIRFQDGTPDDGIMVYISDSNSKNISTNRLFRDPSAWYMITVSSDTTLGTAGDRTRIYVNGVEETSFANEAQPDQNYDYAGLTSGATICIGNRYTGSHYFDGYLADTHFIDGQQLTPAEFGETNDNGVWIPKRFTGSFGTNGFKLEYKQSGTGTNASGMGADTSGNDNHFAVSNLTATDQTTDSPTNNWCTLNSVHVSSHGSSTLPTFSEGNLKIAMSDGSSTSSSIAPSSGKWYVEYKQSENTADNQGYPIVGISATLGGTAGDVIGFRTPSGTNYRGQLGTSSIDNAFLSARQANDIFGFYIDLDNSTLIIHKNGSTYMNTGYTGGLNWSGGLTTTNSQTGFFHFYVQSNTGNAFTDEVNFGNPSFSISSGNADANGFGNFEYSPTLSGTNYYALCTKNLAEYG